MLIAFASPRAPEQERDVLTTSANSLQPLHQHPPLASSPPKKRVVFVPDDNTGCPPPPPPLGRSGRDPKIPIGPAQPNRASSFPRFPPYEAFGRRPRAQSQRPCKGRRPKPFSEADVADRESERRNRAESAPTEIASGRTGVRAIAAVAPRARRFASRPNRKFNAPCRPAECDARRKFPSHPARPFQSPRQPQGDSGCAAFG